MGTCHSTPGAFQNQRLRARAQPLRRLPPEARPTAHILPSLQSLGPPPHRRWEEKEGVL